MTTKPSTARTKINFVTEDGKDVFKIAATGACEVVSVSVLAGSLPCVFRLVDTNSGFTPDSPPPSYAFESGPAFGATPGQSFSPNLNQPFPMTKGVVIVCEQGVGGNAECFVTLN